jgi:ribosomal protein L32
MAVPKKKISYSKTRKRLLTRKANLRSYVQCPICTSFVHLHRSCPTCSVKGSSFAKARTTSDTNINKLYDIHF